MPMRRVGFILVVLVAAAILFEPLIHTHPLTQTAPSPCAVCVSAVGRVTPLSAAPVSPLVALSAVVTLIVTSTIRRSHQPLASRAPPAA